MFLQGMYFLKCWGGEKHNQDKYRREAVSRLVGLYVNSAS